MIDLVALGERQRFEFAKRALAQPDVRAGSSKIGCIGSAAPKVGLQRNSGVSVSRSETRRDAQSCVDTGHVFHAQGYPGTHGVGMVGKFVDDIDNVGLV
jgi:hypothetical protein